MDSKTLSYVAETIPSILWFRKTPSQKKTGATKIFAFPYFFIYLRTWRYWMGRRHRSMGEPFPLFADFEYNIFNEREIGSKNLTQIIKKFRLAWSCTENIILGIIFLVVGKQNFQMRKPGLSYLSHLLYLVFFSIIFRLTSDTCHCNYKIIFWA